MLKDIYRWDRIPLINKIMVYPITLVLTMSIKVIRISHFWELDSRDGILDAPLLQTFRKVQSSFRVLPHQWQWPPAAPDLYYNNRWTRVRVHPWISFPAQTQFHQYRKAIQTHAWRWRRKNSHRLQGKNDWIPWVISFLHPKKRRTSHSRRILVIRTHHNSVSEFLTKLLTNSPFRFLFFNKPLYYSLYKKN